MVSKKEDEIKDPKCIFIVDDEEVIREFVQHLLISKGYEVVTCLNGHEALKMMINRPPDLILLDVQMPVLDGYGFIIEKEKIPHLADIPVIVLTVFQETERLFIRHGVRAYLPKPINPEEMLDKVQACFRP
jgi:CheY-like chemotaxis protein